MCVLYMENVIGMNSRSRATGWEGDGVGSLDWSGVWSWREVDEFGKSFENSVEKSMG